MATIMYDGRDAFRQGGTGIATYARTLAVLARKMGFGTQQIVSSEVPLSTKDPIFNEISFYDVTTPTAQIMQMLRVGWACTLGGFADIRPVHLARGVAVVDPTPASRAVYDTTFASFKLFLIAEALYRVHRRRAMIRFDTPPAVFHSTFPTPLAVRGAANIYTIHDIIPLRLPYATLTNKRFYYNMIREVCAKADHIVTVSEFSRRDIIKLTGMAESRITNTYQCVDIPAALRNRSDDEVARDLEHIFGLDFGGYYLFTGAIEPKKNITRLIDGHLASGTDRPLVLAGGLGWQYKGDVKRMQDERFFSYRIDRGSVTPRRSVRQVDHVPFSQLVSLIRGARAVVFPSLYEGFGLPVLEAMLLGTPVITSNVASLPEVAGRAALMVDPTDIGAIAKAIRTIDKDADLRLDLIERGRKQAAKFSTAAYEDRVRTVYNPYA